MSTRDRIAERIDQQAKAAAEIDSAILPSQYLGNGVVQRLGQKAERADAVIASGAIGAGQSIDYSARYVDGLPAARREEPDERVRVPDAAILYSIEVGSVIEFWLITKSQDVKIAEIASSSAYPISISGSYSASSNTFVDFVSIDPIPDPYPYTLRVTLNVTYSHQHVEVDEAFNNKDVRAFIFFSDFYVEGGAGYNPPGTDGLGNFVGSDSRVVEILIEPGQYTYLSDSKNEYTLGVPFAPGSGPAASGQPTASLFFVAGSQLFGAPYSSIDGTYSITVEKISGASAGNYEAYLSEAQKQPVTLIKHNLNGGVFQDLIYQEGLSIDLQQATNNPALPTILLNTWRDLIVNYNTAANYPGGGPACTDAYLFEPDVNLKNQKFRQIDLDQDVNGITLREHLETISGKVNATVDEANFAENGNCNLGTLRQSRIKLTSPGRGKVEGIVWLR